MKTLYEYILSSALNYKNNTALVENSSRISYTDLLKKIIIISDQLILEGLQKGDRVIVDLTNPLNQFVATMAIIRSGGVAVPFKKSISSTDKEFIFQHTKPFTTITDQKFSRHNQINQSIFQHSIFHWDEEILNSISEYNDSEAILCIENDNAQKISRLIQPDPADLVFIHYENDTKKLIAYNHRSIIYPAILLNQILDINPSHRELISFPLYDIHGFSRVIQNLISGTTSFLLKNIDDKLSIPAYILKNKCNSLFSGLELVNFLLSNLKSLTQEVLKNFIMIHLNAGEISLINDFLKLDPSEIKTTKIFLSFSPLEAPMTTLTSYNEPDLHNMCLGFPLPGIKLKIFESHDKNSPHNGKLCIQGNNTMEGYYIEGTLDRSLFTDDNWLITDQYAFIDERGKLYLKGTIDEVVFINTDIISIQQINKVLSKLLTEFNCDYYIILKQDPFEKNKNVPILFYVPDPENPIEPIKILEEIKKLSVEYLNNILIFKVKNIPKSGNKVLKDELLKLISNNADNI